MNKVLAFLILGMGFTGSVLIISVVLLFKSRTGIVLQIAVASSFVLAVFTVWALVIRKRFENELK
nr:hypothetical protein [Lysinibacillus fusiformis]